ncbi:PR domain zinc finger protein 5 isoform X4 [Pieris rapae]|uniref:PR domain zinc finger protein 5 isoform X4 n=1 Tax=Pieris rapae TaxID=64459 RepID=UPI001E280548|nr:PR domain zinc finger protein 5 isoform X4 [Pieris rapae]
MEGKVWRPGPTVCRCCLSEGCYKDISTEYFWMGKKEVYADMLSDTFDLSIQYAPTGGPNSQSRLICEPCISRLRDATDFRRQIKECEQTFMEYLNPSTTVDIEIPVELPEKEHKIVSVKVEKPLSDDDDFGDTELLDDDDLDDEPLMNLASKVPKKESVDVTDLIDNAKAEKRKSTTKAKAAPKKAKVKEAKPSVSKAKPEKKKKGEIHIEASNMDTRIKNDRKLKDLDAIKAKKKNATLLLEHTRLSPFRWMKNLYICFYCDQQYIDPAILRHHILVDHNFVTSTVIKYAMSKLKRHELVKVDITDISCKLCDEVTPDLNYLKHHLADAHNKTVDVNTTDEVLPFRVTKDSFNCAVCDERFDEFKTLNHHMNVHFQNFICEQCGAGFITPERLRTHAFSHESGSFSCESCEKVFRSVNAKNEHFANVHKQVRRHRCPHCPEAFRNYFQRNKHIAAVHGIKLKEFKCNLCVKVFTSSGKLGVHVRTVHLKMKRHGCSLCEWKFYSKSELKEHMIRHGGERKFNCNICKKSYARKYTLREHMRIHENDRRFVCSYCGGSFVQKCSLNHHVKVNHPTVKITEFHPMST